MTHSPEITDEYRYYLLRRRLAEDLILRAFRGLRREGIEPILIKGWAAARNYPAGKTRFFGDIDLAVSAADYPKAKDVIAAAGQEMGGIDLHRELRHLDTVDWDRLFSSSETVPLDGENIRVLCAEDHLRILCVHWLIDGGERRDRLWDIVYAIQNRPIQFDWSKCVDVVSETRRYWIIAAIGIAHKYSALDLHGIPFADEARTLPSWITKCLEREWDRNVELRSLASQLRYPGGFIRQLKKRIPPNPIQATINCDGDLRSRTRIGYQIRDMAKRFLPVVKDISAAIVEKQH